MINTGREMDVPDAKAKYLVDNNTAVLIEVKAEEVAKPKAKSEEAANIAADAAKADKK